MAGHLDAGLLGNRDDPLEHVLRPGVHLVPAELTHRVALLLVVLREVEGGLRGAAAAGGLGGALVGDRAEVVVEAADAGAPGVADGGAHLLDRLLALRLLGRGDERRARAPGDV